MQSDLQITARDFTLNAAVEAEIREKAARLEHYYERGRISGCHVIVEGAVGHHRHGGPFKVRIDLRLPGGELSVDRQSADDLAVAIREAFDAARRELQDYARKQRGEVKTVEAPAHARVTKLFPARGVRLSDHTRQPRSLLSSQQCSRRCVRPDGDRNGGQVRRGDG